MEMNVLMSRRDMSGEEDISRVGDTVRRKIYFGGFLHDKSALW